MDGMTPPPSSGQMGTDSPSGPKPSPMAGPSQNKGNKQLGMVNVESAMQLMDQSLAHLGSSSPEGAAVIKALTALSKTFSRQANAPLVPAQLQSLQQGQATNPIAQMLSKPGGIPGQPQ